MQQRKLSINATDFLSVAAADMLDSFVNGHVENRVAGGVEQIDEPFDVSVIVHGSDLKLRRISGTKAGD